MTGRTLPAVDGDYTARNGRTYHFRSLIEQDFMRYLDLYVPAEPWSYEAQLFRDNTAATRIDFCVQLAECCCRIELKPDGFLGWTDGEVDKAIRKLEVVRRQRPRDRVCLMTWRAGWADLVASGRPIPGVWLLGYKADWYLVEAGQASLWRAAA
jgi:hypothetical protein